MCPKKSSPKQVRQANHFLADKKEGSRDGSKTRLPYKPTWEATPGLDILLNTVRRRYNPKGQLRLQKCLRKRSQPREHE